MRRGRKPAGWSGRETIPGWGLSFSSFRAPPRLLGPAVRSFKSLVGVCSRAGCAKIAGHGGPHS